MAVALMVFISSGLKDLQGHFQELQIYKDREKMVHSQYTLMSDYIRSQSFSHSSLNITVNFLLPERPPYFASGIENTESSPKRKIKLNNNLSETHQTRVQLLKSRLISGLENSKAVLKRNSFEQIPLFRNVRLNQLFAKTKISQNMTTQSVQSSTFEMRRQLGHESVTNKLLSRFRKQEKSKTEIASKDDCLKQSKQAGKLNKSIMIFRKMNKMKEKMALCEKQKFQQQLYKRRETPIHHSQFFDTTKNRKRKADQKFNSSNKNAIQDIVKLRETMNKSGAFKKMAQKQPFEAVLKGEAKFDQDFIFKRNNQSLKMSVQEYINQKKRKKLTKNMVDKAFFMKTEDDIGPWMKLKDCEIQF